MTPGQKAAHTRKWRNVGRDTVPTNETYKGVVDMIAVKRDQKNPDKLHVMLLQVKGNANVQ